MADTGKTGKAVLVAIVMFIAAILVLGIVLWAGIYTINHLPAALKNIGSTATSTPISENGIIGTVAKVVLGVAPPITYEQLILFIAIFLILMFALADLIQLLSTFSETTSWVIAFGLAIIAGVTKMIYYIAGIFGITAGIGAVGIAIIIIMAIIAGVVINIGFGKAIQKWALQRQIGVTSAKVAKGFGKASAAAKGLRDMADEIEK